MKRTILKNQFAALIVILVSGIYVSAQSDIAVSIQNTSGEDRKVCIYNPEDAVGLVPKTCVTMKKDESALWQNKGAVPFMVKVFKPAIFDEYIYTRQLPGDTRRIIVAEGGRFGFSREDAPKRYFLKACNRQWDETVYFVLGFETYMGSFTEGWWTLEKGKCIDFPISEKIKTKYDIGYGYRPKIYFYAQTKKQGQTLEWKGGESDPDLCIDKSNVFMKDRFRTNDPFNLLPCDGTSDKLARFRELAGSDTTYPAFNLVF
ncbi:MAG: DUF1036 domain-containing protein [Pyrinomonadaceae bacterium]